MSDAAGLADAAEAFMGVRFRLHGRDPATGLDCVGLVAASLRAIGLTAQEPRGYRLRNASIAGWLDTVSQSGLVPVHGPVRRGDVLLISPGPAQHHLIIAQGRGWVIHAHSGLGRVVSEPVTAPLKAVAHWRLDSSTKED
jgi:cell wall-associated NlpC family hydrolase